MRTGDADAVVDRLGADLEQKDVLSAVVIVEFVAGLHRIAEGIWAVAGGFCNPYTLGHGLALGFCGVQKPDIALCIFIGGVYDFLACLFVYGLLLIADGILLFRHDKVSFKNYDS